MVDFVVSPTRSWNRITPADGDLINPEIVRIYNNLNHLKDAQENPDLGFQQLNNTPSSFAGKAGYLPTVNDTEDGIVYSPWFGLIDGGLKFNNVAVPATLSAGFYGINGKLVQKTSDATIATTDTILQSRQSLDSFCHYLVLMNSAGQVKYCLYGEGAVSGATGNITSITGSGTTKTLTIASGSVGAHTNKILVITGNDGVNGVFKITGGNGSSTYQFESVSALTGGASGTWTVYERISTLHGTGSNTAITVDADVLKYTPSYGENGWASAIVSFDSAKNGFYLNLPGFTDWRVIGNFHTNTSSETQGILVSHKSGRDKDDNDFYVHNSAYGSTANKILRFTTTLHIRGCDFVLIPNDTVNACTLTLKRVCNVMAGLTHGTTTGAIFGMSLNASSLTTIFNSLPAQSQLMGTTHGITNYLTLSTITRKLHTNDTVRPHSDGVTIYSAGLNAFYGRLVL